MAFYGSNCINNNDYSNNSIYFYILSSNTTANYDLTMSSLYWVWIEEYYKI